MSILTGFTHQTATLERLVPDAYDVYGEPLYGAPETIRVRLERRQRWVMAENGIRGINSTYVLTEARLNPGDNIDGRKIEAVEDIISKGGKFLGTECYL
jgi:hypothetical protein